MTNFAISPRHGPRLRARPGVALVMAVVAMAVLGVLVAGVFFTALREERDGRDAVHRVQALATAEYGLATALSPASWQSSWKITRRRGMLHLFAPEVGANTSDTVQLWKLDRNSFLLVSSGGAGPAISRAKRRIALLVALRIPRLAARSAVMSQDGVSVTDSSLVSGADTIPPGWDCPPADDVRPALMVPAASLVDSGECTAFACLAGEPLVRIDSLAAMTDTYERFGAFDRGSMAATALQLPDDIVITAAPAVNEAGECAGSRLDNLGDPLRLLGADSPCADYFPLVHAPGNMRIEGGAGQGFLIVDGNLTISADARFFGVVVVRGVLEITEGAELGGALLASRVIVHAGSIVRYSSCAVERALRAAAEPVVPLGQAWSEMY